jgi:hypothetical protein
MPAKIAMMAITTRSSINVKAEWDEPRLGDFMAAMKSRGIPR